MENSGEVEWSCVTGNITIPLLVTSAQLLQGHRDPAPSAQASPGVLADSHTHSLAAVARWQGAVEHPSSTAK